jgi:hypothetical protein
VSVINPPYAIYVDGNRMENSIFRMGCQVAEVFTSGACGTIHGDGFGRLLRSGP